MVVHRCRRLAASTAATAVPTAATAVHARQRRRSPLRDATLLLHVDMTLFCCDCCLDDKFLAALPQYCVGNEKFIALAVAYVDAHRRCVRLRACV